MINKNKILKAINEGILTGFKISSNKVDDSEYIDFEDSKISNVESLNIDKILKDFENCVLINDRLKILDYLNHFGLDVFEKYRTYKIIDSIYKAINKLGFEYVKEHILPTSNKQLHFAVNYAINNVGNTADLNWIDTSNIRDMSDMFSHSSFNGDISCWDVSNVNDMNNMFDFAKFNKDISNWDVSNVKHMSWMFNHSKFNKDISNWNVSNVIYMNYMFSESKFNNDISNWDVSNVNSMAFMFWNSNFNNDISNWDVSNVPNMKRMFYGSQFNKDISKWKIDNKCVVDNIFDNCPIEDKNKPDCLKDIK